MDARVQGEVHVTDEALVTETQSVLVPMLSATLPTVRLKNEGRRHNKCRKTATQKIPWVLGDRRMLVPVVS